MTDWHRLFGLLLMDFFTGSPFTVELEKDLSLQKQLLDVIVLRKGRGRFHGRLPDGLDNLATHNLITFKSHHEALDDWALKELTGHYVNYRKQISPAPDSLLPETDFRLYAVCSRFPHNLPGGVSWQHLHEGVYECRRGTDLIRVIVLRELPTQKHNAVLHLISAKPELTAFGATNYEKRSSGTNTLVYQLFEGFEQEGIAMPYTMEDFQRDFIKEHAEKLLQGLTPEQRLRGLSPEERLRGLPPEERLRGLPPEERLRGLPPEEIEKYLERRKKEGAARKPKKKK